MYTVFSSPSLLGESNSFIQSNHKFNPFQSISGTHHLKISKITHLHTLTKNIKALSAISVQPIS